MDMEEVTRGGKDMENGQSNGGQGRERACISDTM